MQNILRKESNLEGGLLASLPVGEQPFFSTVSRVADVEGPRDRRSPKGQGLLRKEGPPKYCCDLRAL